VKVICNSIYSDHAKASDRSNNHDYDYASENASDNANDRTRRVMIM
jgi:hypothetical protein